MKKWQINKLKEAIIRNKFTNQLKTF